MLDPGLTRDRAFLFLLFLSPCFRVRNIKVKRNMPEKYEVAIIDLHLVILGKSSPIKIHSKLPVSTVELIGILECIYVIFSVLEFNIKFFLKIPHNSDFFLLWRMRLLLDLLLLKTRKNETRSEGRR